MRRIVLALLVAVAPLAARAQVSLDLEAMLGAPRAGLHRVPGGTEPLTAAGDVGGDALLRLWFLGVGAAFDRNVGEDRARFQARSAMGGFVLDVLPFVRLELLGEVGHVRGAGTPQARFQGARPGLSLRLPKFPLRVGVWGLARWGLPDHAPGRPAYGALLRVGLEL